MKPELSLSLDWVFPPKIFLNLDLFQIPRLCELRPYLSRNYTREEFIQLEFVS